MARELGNRVRAEGVCRSGARRRRARRRGYGAALGVRRLLTGVVLQVAEWVWRMSPARSAPCGGRLAGRNLAPPLGSNGHGVEGCFDSANRAVCDEEGQGSRDRDNETRCRQPNPKFSLYEQRGIFFTVDTTPRHVALHATRSPMPQESSSSPAPSSSSDPRRPCSAAAGS